MTKNSLFTQFLRLSGMRPGVGEKGESVSGRAQLYHPLVSCNARNSTVSVSVKDGRKKPSTFLVSGGCSACPKVQGLRPVSHPHSQHSAFRGVVLLRTTFRIREALLLEYCAQHLGVWFWKAVAVSAPLCGLTPVTGAAMSASLSCSSQSQTPVFAHSLKK